MPLRVPDCARHSAASSSAINMPSPSATSGSQLCRLATNSLPGVTVTCLCPGPTDTKLQERAGMEKTRLVKTLRPMEAKTVAQDGYRGLMAGKTLVISGFRNWLVAESLRFSPRKIVTAVSRKLLDQAE